MNGRARGAEVVIVGGGVTGLSAGWWLARAGVAVTVVEKGVIGTESSGRNGGGATHYYSPLFAEEQRLWPQMDALLGHPTEFRPWRIGIALDEEQRQRYRRMAEYLALQGFPSDELSRAELRERVPLAGDNVLGATLFRVGGQANPQRTVEGYARALQDLGGRLLQRTSVLGFERRGGRVSSVLTSAGPLYCDIAVLAAGAHTGALAAKLGIALPLGFARVEMLATEPLPPMAIGGVDGNRIYGRQTLRGNLVYGGGPHEWLDGPDPGSRPATPLVRNLARRLADLFPNAGHVRVLRSWAGVVENTPDGRPVLDRPAEPGNVVVATMSSVGFGLSPASGRAVAELAMHGRCGFADLRTLSLARFDGLAEDWREAAGWLPRETLAAARRDPVTAG